MDPQRLIKRTHTLDLSFGRKRNRGALVLLEEAYMDEFLWFIPESAIAYE